MLWLPGLVGAVELLVAGLVGPAVLWLLGLVGPAVLWLPVVWFAVVGVGVIVIVGCMDVLEGFILVGVGVTVVLEVIVPVLFPWASPCTASET